MAIRYIEIDEGQREYFRREVIPLLAKEAEGRFSNIGVKVDLKISTVNSGIQYQP